MLGTLPSTATSVAIAAAAGVAVALLYAELRALRRALLLTAAPKGEQGVAGGLQRNESCCTTLGRQGSGLTAAGIGRMNAVGSVLSSLPRAEHNRLVAALSRRAAPVSQWGPVLTAYPDVVNARLASLQTGDLILTSTRVGSWVGNTIQTLTDSTWNHVAVVVRGRIVGSMEEDSHSSEYLRESSERKRQYVPRAPWHFEVSDDADAQPHLLEASWQGVHIYPNSFADDHADGTIHDRLLRDPAYDEYSTIAVRALQGVERTPAMRRALEDWIVKARGAAFEWDAPLHNIFSEAAGSLESMHCAELTTETLKVLGLVPPDFVSGTAPPCVYADAPLGTVQLLHGAYGPMEIIKAEDESADAKLANVEFRPQPRLRHEDSVSALPPKK